MGIGSMKLGDEREGRKVEHVVAGEVFREADVGGFGGCYSIDELAPWRAPRLVPTIKAEPGAKVFACVRQLKLLPTDPESSQTTKKRSVLGKAGHHDLNAFELDHEASSTSRGAPERESDRQRAVNVPARNAD
eukprot:6002513-Pyramimonas_sp.AAC.1